MCVDFFNIFVIRELFAFVFVVVVTYMDMYTELEL